MAGRGEQAVIDFMDCWRRLDLEDAVSRIAEDMAFQPDPKAEVVRGRETIRALWAGYMKGMKTYALDVRQIAEGGGVVFLERMERLEMPDGRKMALPITGVYEIDAAGKIAAWRDYWDPAMAPPPP